MSRTVDVLLIKNMMAMVCHIFIHFREKADFHVGMDIERISIVLAQPFGYHYCAIRSKRYKALIEQFV